MAVVKGRARTLLALHILLLLYSSSGVLSKSAALRPPMSFGFVALYAGMLAVLFVYAIGWQQVIKRLPLTLAFANKAIYVVWGIVWGVLLFGERLTPGMVAGAVLVMAGIVLFSTDPADASAPGDPGEGDGE